MCSSPIIFWAIDLAYMIVSLTLGNWHIMQELSIAGNPYKMFAHSTTYSIHKFYRHSHRCKQETKPGKLHLQLHIFRHSPLTAFQVLKQAEVIIQLNTSYA